MYDYARLEQKMWEYEAKLSGILQQRAEFARLCVEKYEAKLRSLHPGNHPFLHHAP